MLNIEDFREKIGAAQTLDESKQIAHYLLGYIRALTQDDNEDNSTHGWDDLTFRLPPDRPRFKL